MILHPTFTIQTQGFGENANTLYRGEGLKGHPAIDYDAFCGSRLLSAARALCYSTINKDNPDLSKYRAALFLYEEGDKVYEIIYGHMDEIYAVPGKTYDVGDVIGTTGNTGDVYTNGVKVEKYRPGCPGGHLHFQVRECRKVTKMSRTKRYLSDGHGIYRKDGFYIEIVDYNNGYNGCIDPSPFMSKMLASDFKLPPYTAVSYEEAIANLRKAGLPRLVLTMAELVLKGKYNR
jgi:murein DD-endopeptidase MepM/ murein hydrolase activator NlpD